MSNIKIRVATTQDAAALLAIYAPYVETTAITFEYEVPSVEVFAERIRAVQSKYPFLVAEADGEILGYAYAGPFNERAAYDWTAETTVYVKIDRKGQGTGSRLYEALSRILKAQGVLNLTACIAYPESEDIYLTTLSVVFHEKLGYRLVGQFDKCGYKFNRWYHIVWMEKHIGEHMENPSRVKPFGEIKTLVSGILWQ